MKEKDQPFAPLLSSELPEGMRTIWIRSVSIVFSDRRGVRLPVFETDRAYVAFSRLTEAALNREEVVSFSCGGFDADFASVAGLNCYLRAARTMGRMRMPFARLERGRHRYAWAEFCSYLGLEFR